MRINTNFHLLVTIERHMDTHTQQGHLISLEYEMEHTSIYTEDKMIASLMRI
jgi:hypothetical protein